MTATKAERAQALERLREIVSPGDTLTTVLRHVSSSGMSRLIDVYLLKCEGGRVSRYWLSYNAALALGWPFDDKKEAVRVSGAGMDMGFHLVYALAATIFPYGTKVRCSGKDCPSNEHNNQPYPKRDRRTFHPGGGYTLRHEWLG